MFSGNERLNPSQFSRHTFTREDRTWDVEGGERELLGQARRAGTQDHRY
jgi:hypothetical protein